MTTESAMDAWIEAQKVLWESWGNLALSTPSAPFSSDLIERWQELARQSFGARTAGAAPVAQSVADQFLATQSILLRFLEFSARAWETVAPKLEAGQDWQAAMKEAVDQLRRQWLQFPSEAAGPIKDSSSLWQLYLEQWKSFGQPWEAVLQQVPGYWGQAATNKSTAQMEFTRLYQEAYGQTFGRLASSPGLGLTREFNQKLRQGFDAWVAWRLASVDYQAVMAELWEQTFEQFAHELVALAQQDKKVESVWELILAWTRGAEQIFTEAFRSEKYVLAQGKLINTSMAYRVRQRALVEEFLKMYDLPTRSELDEAHRRIYELRKEVKALKKALEKHKHT